MLLSVTYKIYPNPPAIFFHFELTLIDGAASIGVFLNDLCAALPALMARTTPTWGGAMDTERIFDQGSATENPTVYVAITGSFWCVFVSPSPFLLLIDRPPTTRNATFFLQCLCWRFYLERQLDAGCPGYHDVADGFPCVLFFLRSCLQTLSNALIERDNI